jgi:thymidylate synthase (FAD)
MFKTIQECRLDLVAHSMDKTYRNLDFFPCSAARVSFGNEDKTGDDEVADTKLMRYLAKHDHLSPFEHQSATFLIEVPLFIRSQIMRHRTFAYNEISRRYTDESIEFWIPDKFRKQSKSNKQASDGELDHTNFLEWLGWEKDENEIPHPSGTMNGADGFNQWRWSCYTSWHDYLAMLESGVCREQARALLPQSLLTKFYMTGNLRNWVHFLKLRLDDHAQYEVRVVAERIRDKLLELWPTATGVLLNDGRTT